MVLFTAHIPEALENGCDKCSENQKQGIQKVVKYMIKNDPENWKKLEKIYDPDGTSMKKYATELEKMKAWIFTRNNKFTKKHIKM